MINVIVRSPEDAQIYVASPALVDTGADYSVITPAIFETLMPLRAGRVHIAGYVGKPEFVPLYSVNIEIHDWRFDQVPVLVGSDDYTIIGRDLLNQFDLRLNGIDGKLEFLRGPQV
jgi:predicted aspartyl protease